jgi:flagellin-specific chaperone FliS
MATQKTVAEEAKKRLLNSDQKKMLFRLFEKKIDEKKQARETLSREEREKKDEELERNAEKIPAVAKLIKKIREARKEEETAEKELRKLGYGMNSYNENATILSGHKEIISLEKKQEKILQDMENLKMKLLADIYGLPMSYEEIISHIDKEMARIEQL